MAEARAHLARAEGDPAGAARLFAAAADLFSLAGQPIDVQRCLEAVRTGPGRRPALDAGKVGSCGSIDIMSVIGV